MICLDCEDHNLIELSRWTSVALDNHLCHLGGQSRNHYTLRRRTLSKLQYHSELLPVQGDYSPKGAVDMSHFHTRTEWIRLADGSTLWNIS